MAVSLRRLNSRNYVLGLMGNGQGSSDHETLKLPPSSAGSGHSGASNRPRVASPHAAVHIAMDRFVVSVSISPPSGTCGIRRRGAALNWSLIGLARVGGDQVREVRGLHLGKLG